MEIWLEEDTHGSLIPDSVSRIWRGRSDEVAEIDIEDFRGQEEAISLIGSAPWILVRCSDWTMIPLENLIASSKGSGTRIAAAISNEIELSGASLALGLGVDAILVKGDLVELAIKALGTTSASLDSTVAPHTPLCFARVFSVESCGLGERVCIDLTQRLNEGEGMALGSVSGMLCLVHGETVPSEYVPSRPFRVNAGAIHSYVLMADGTTKYLSELNASDEVAILSLDGSRRSAVVGRLKIENRPLLVIRYRSDEQEGQVIAQQAETVRLVKSDGGLISITDLSDDVQIAVLSDSRMRHVGIALEGGMVER